ncbi:sensor histidine kinase [Luteimonas sp. SJ-92]|uniref:Sensor histidine kinase n=1 Tax=Luteimonas salinisoli TaxID=2752307 RepID=A0A853JDP0_9GAMM|nr:sensor histidine kinase [Luteimonas salinisoli]NZA26965.1 sensor histidine kinase [Luteimonas salinisoli]
MNPDRLPRWLRPAADSVVGHAMRLGKSPWIEAVHLLWSVWIFITPAFTPHGYDLRWLLLTLASYPLFLLLYARVLLAPARTAHRHAVAMVAMSLALLPWYPAGLSYFVFGCVLLHPQRMRALPYLGLLLALNGILIGWALWLGYPWRTLLAMPLVTLVVGVVVHVERIGQRNDRALKLSHDEVRRLAATAERERIGRDLHDLLGHTLSMVALKSDLAARLVARDPNAARAEIEQVARGARDALAQVRRAVSGIRAAGIAAELASARLLLETDGVAFGYRVDGDAGAAALPPGVETALALTVREAVTNIQRHARANHAEVRLALEDGEAVLCIVDDGRGGAIVPGNGLGGMRERLEAARGRLCIEPAPGGGTRIEARVPLGVQEQGAA